MSRSFSHSVIGKIILILFALILFAGAALFFMYKANTPFTEYVDYQLAYHYEETGDYENIIKYYKKINTEESLSYLDETYSEYAKKLLEEGNYLKALKMYQSMSKMTRTQREHLQELIQTDDFINGIQENLKDPNLFEEDIPEYIPVKITAENFDDYFFFTEELHPNLDTGEGTTFYLHLRDEIKPAFDYENELNTVSASYSYSEVTYSYRHFQMGSKENERTPAVIFTIRDYPNFYFRSFLDCKDSDYLTKLDISYLSYGYNSPSDPYDISLAQNIKIESAEGLLFIKPEALK